jgi:hypothetical protein
MAAGGRRMHGNPTAEQDDDNWCVQHAERPKRLVVSIAAQQFPVEADLERLARRSASERRRATGKREGE